VHHIALLVTDLIRAEAFYGGVLGLRVNRRWFMPDGTDPRSVWFELGPESFLAVELIRDANGTPRQLESPGWNLLALSIRRDERDRWRERVASAGFPVTEESAYTLYLRDPEGHRVGLSHWPLPAELSAPRT
jgi:catechol 2,3-dioxygenase-like lactoylglutathione lyase family enzyme